WNRAAVIYRRKSWSLRRRKISGELGIQTDGIAFINASHMGRSPRRQTAKFLNHGGLIILESLAGQIVVLIECVDKFLQFVAHEQGSELFAVGFLDVDRSMPSVEMSKNKIAHR